MKKLVALAIVLTAMALYADEIHLKDGSVVRGEVKASGSEKIFYRDETTFHAKEIPLADVERIVYPEGLTVNPHEKNFDDIHKKDGSIVKAKVLRVTGDMVIAHGEKEIVPRRLPLDELSKVIFSGGRTISFSDTGRAAAGPQSGDGALAAETFPPPTHHVDGEMNLFFMILGGIGVTRNPDINSYTEQQARRYLTHLQADYIAWDNNSVGTLDNPYNPDFDLEIEARLFDDFGMGLGISGGVSFIIPGTVDISDPAGNTMVQVDSFAFFAYCAATLYLKEYIATRNSMAFYLLAGAGIGYYRGFASITISEGYDSTYGTPDREMFEEDFSGSAIGYHGTVELGIEQSHFVIMAGLRVRYVEIDELSSGGKTMRLDNGSNAVLKLNGAMLYAGIGLFL
jgi:hypothetical protein